MTKYFRIIYKTLTDNGENLNKKDVLLIRGQYSFISDDEFIHIGQIEEAILQIAMNPKNKLTLEQI